jgi:integral membrane protein
VTKNFRTIAYVEAVSFLVLLAASFVKRVVEGPDLVPVLGMVHGIIFLIYVVFVLKVRPEQGWGVGRTIWVIVAAALPFGGFFVGRDLKTPVGEGAG